MFVLNFVVAWESLVGLADTMVSRVCFQSDFFSAGYSHVFQSIAQDILKEEDVVCDLQVLAFARAF